METNSNQLIDNTFANNTLISIPTGLKSIDNFKKGDAVSAISVKFKKKKKKKFKVSSSEAKISFTANTSSSQSGAVVGIAIENLNIPNFVCSSHLPFLLSNGKYIRAHKLIPGQEIVNKDGEFLKIENLVIANQKIDIHHISTNSIWNNTPNGHLLLANGIVVGDYILELYLDQLPLEMIQ
jgi:hypothetical protein